jgi:hypothetical protein
MFPPTEAEAVFELTEFRKHLEFMRAPPGACPSIRDMLDHVIGLRVGRSQDRLLSGIIELRRLLFPNGRGVKSDRNRKEWGDVRQSIIKESCPAQRQAA